MGGSAASRRLHRSPAGFFCPASDVTTSGDPLHLWGPSQVSCIMADSYLSSSGNSSSPALGSWNITGSGPWLLAFMLAVIILMTVCGNTLLIALVFAHRSLRCTSNCFLVSLFLSDLMVALVVMPPAMLNVLCGSWVLSPAFCPVWLCFDVMCCSASILNLCIISLDRYLFIISPLRYKQRMTPPRALLLVGAAWGLAALASFLPIEMKWHSLGHWSGTGVGGGSISSYPESYFQLSPSGGRSFQCRLQVTLPFALVASVLTFFLPSSAICFTYCRILLAARRQAKRVAALSHPPHPHASLGEPSRPPSPGLAGGAGQQDGDDCSHQEQPISQNLGVRKKSAILKCDTECCTCSCNEGNYHSIKKNSITAKKRTHLALCLQLPVKMLCFSNLLKLTQDLGASQ